MRTSTRWLCGCRARRVREQVAPVAGAYLLSERAVSMLVDDRRASADPVTGLREHGGQPAQDSDGCLLLPRRVVTGCRGQPAHARGAGGDVGRAAHYLVRVPGPVRVHPTAQLDHTLVRGLAVIGPGARLSHAYVGPYTSIGANVTVDGSQVEHSTSRGPSSCNIGPRVETSVIGAARGFGAASRSRRRCAWQSGTARGDALMTGHRRPGCVPGVAATAVT